MNLTLLLLFCAHHRREHRKHSRLQGRFPKICSFIAPKAITNVSDLHSETWFVLVLWAFLVFVFTAEENTENNSARLLRACMEDYRKSAYSQPKKQISQTCAAKRNESHCAGCEHSGFWAHDEENAANIQARTLIKACMLITKPGHLRPSNQCRRLAQQNPLNLTMLWVSILFFLSPTAETIYASIFQARMGDYRKPAYVKPQKP